MGLDFHSTLFDFGRLFFMRQSFLGRRDGRFGWFSLFGHDQGFLDQLGHFFQHDGFVFALRPGRLASNPQRIRRGDPSGKFLPDALFFRIGKIGRIAHMPDAFHHGLHLIHMLSALAATPGGLIAYFMNERVHVQMYH